ncbi:MAG: FprA family A-type flavoprotein [Dehalococcoidales bacterium]|nr:FprA family A-type flavoprotein [Dehalococcoidales bacterium]
MKPRELTKDIYCVGAIDWDRRLFDSLVPLPDGTSYNAYLIKGSQKTALIDTVNPPMQDVLFDNLNDLGVKRIDYVVFNHAEPDHSGTISEILEKYPEAKAVCTDKCKAILIDRFGVPDAKFQVVADKETISLGDRTLEFIHAPWVHWPETMLTYLREDKILFPCDLFASHLAITDLFVRNAEQELEAATRFYAEIMMPFRQQIQKHLETLKNYEIKIIAPSHGPMHDKPKYILNAYNSWVNDPPGNIVVIPYVSMHGSTRQMVAHLVTNLTRRGVTVKQFDLAASDVGKLAMALVDAATIVIGSPTVLTGPHPGVAYAAFLANAVRPKARFASIIGSYGWGGRVVDAIAAMIPNLRVEIIPPVIIKGYPKEADYKALDALADAIVAKHKEAGLK